MLNIYDEDEALLAFHTAEQPQEDRRYQRPILTQLEAEKIVRDELLAELVQEAP